MWTSQWSLRTFGRFLLGWRPDAAAMQKLFSKGKASLKRGSCNSAGHCPATMTRDPASDSFKRNLEDYKLVHTIGTGTFGRVYLAQYEDGTGAFAMKVLRKADIVRLRQVEHIRSEREILANYSHPFIVTLYCTFQDSHNLYMLLEYVCGGELFAHLRRAGRFDVSTAQFYSCEIVLAIEFLHSNNVIYRDLKPENLLIDSQGHMKITDFGFAKKVESRTWTLCGTPEYLAPEIIQSKGHGKAVDWWALGILLFEMLAGYPPFFDDNPFGIYEKILNGKINYPSHFDMASRDLVRRLLTGDRTKRLGNLKGGAEDIRRHKFFKGIDWDLALSGGLQPPIIPEISHPADTRNFEKYPELLEDIIPQVPCDDPFRSLFRDF